MREEIKRFKGFRICDKCPCLNTDYEAGSSCNLGYVTDLLDEDFKNNLKKVIDELDDIVKKIKY